MSAEVVPFGKYKGQPVELLAADRDYCEWLTGQPWFKARYLSVYNTVINYGAEPQDSPEHNQMQARFLDDEWCRRLCARLHATAAGIGAIRALRFEADGWDVSYSTQILGSDGSIFRSGQYVECKPDLGDDYPAVLRQVQRYMGKEFSSDERACVLVRRHAFERVTWEQVQKMFAACRIVLLAESEIASAHDPPGLPPKLLSPDERVGLLLVKDRLGGTVIAEAET